MKPENILYLKGVYKIADFGLARVYKNNEELTKAGTPKYASPQLFIQNAQFTNSADIFSLGIICYELMFGNLPYPINSISALMSSLQKLEYSPVKVDRSIQGMTTEIAELIENMLRYHENNRISWINLFSHPLLSDIPKLPIPIFKPYAATQQQGRQNFQQSDPNTQRIQTPINIMPTTDMSDKNYQIASFINQVLDSLDKHINQQKSIQADLIKIKQQLYYLTSCFYEHSKAIKANTFGRFNYSLADVDAAINKLNQSKILLNEQIHNCGLATSFPMRDVQADYNGYFFYLSNLLSTKFLFPYSNKSNYYLEYLQLIFCLQRLKELNEQKEFSIIYQQIMDIQNQLSNEINLRRYLNSKFNI
ncbi:unnamed protein product [Paramecium sonneborni]|nr:unnamed protein product [Paramecium sonneborni]